MKIPFMKAHGAGNDFVIIDKNVDLIRKSKNYSKLCDRRFGIGCDQLILLKKLERIIQVAFYNSDGSLGKIVEMGCDVVYNFS